MENVLKIDLKEIMHTITYLLFVAACFALFIMFTRQSVNNSIARSIENQSNHAIFTVNY